MRTIIIIALIVSATVLKAQTFLPLSYINNTYGGRLAANTHFNDSSQKKLFFTSFSGISTSYSFYKGSHATFFAAPVSLQLNRRLNNNLYAFAGITVAPAYVNFNRSFMSADVTIAALNASGPYMYSGAALGLQYINDERTFSVSGSISVENNNYPALPYYRNTQAKQIPSTYPTR